MNKDSKIYVAGHRGMVGSAIVRELQRQGYANIITRTHRELEFLGSSCIYPRMAPQPMPESCLLTSELEKTNEAYALAKISGLKYCEYLNRQYGTDGTPRKLLDVSKATKLG